MRFRKKPVEIEAFNVSTLLNAVAEAWHLLPLCVEEAYEAGEVVFLPDSILITTLEGTMTAQKDDWLIRGVQGELYPCKPEIFDATYEPVED